MEWTLLPSGHKAEEGFMFAVLDAPIRTTASNLDRVLGAALPTLVVFETPDCSPCRELAPALDALAREYSDRVLVVRVQNAAQGWLAARYHLSFVPTLVFCRGGVETARIKGNPGLAPIRAHLEFLLNRRSRPAPARGPRHTLAATFGGHEAAEEPSRGPAEGHLLGRGSSA